MRTINFDLLEQLQRVYIKIWFREVFACSCTKTFHWTQQNLLLYLIPEVEQAH